MNITIRPEQLIYDSAVVRSDAAPRVHPWQKPLPASLYKYFPPERFHVLTDCAVRFSQRRVFEDEYDLRPQVDNFGTAEEIRAFMDNDAVLSSRPDWIKEAVINLVLNKPGARQKLIQQAQGAMIAPEEFGVFCLCENNRSRSMWNQYAGNRNGFLVAFDTRRPGFRLLTTPGLIGKVDYSDEPISSFLTEYGGSSFFRKRERYRFEAEWRSLRALRRFKKVLQPESEFPIYLAPFAPACVAGIEIMPECTIEMKLRTLVVVDARYQHASVHVVSSASLA